MARALVSLSAVVVVAVVVSGCTTATIRPEAWDVKRVSLVSLHARREIGVQASDLSPVLLDAELGDEVVEMSVADTEGSLEALLGAVVVPAGKAMQSRKYDLVPEALPPEEWSQVNQMLAVDVDAAGTAAALGALAKDLAVDACVVVRHEWWLQRDRLDIGTQTWGYDRFTFLMVDDDGVVLWRQTFVTRAPSRAMFASTFQVGFNGATWADEARTLARETARLAWGELHERYAQGPPKTSAATTKQTTTTMTTTPAPPKPKPPETETPPPPLNEEPQP